MLMVKKDTTTCIDVPQTGPITSHFLYTLSLSLVLSLPLTCAWLLRFQWIKPGE